MSEKILASRHDCEGNGYDLVWADGRIEQRASRVDPPSHIPYGEDGSNLLGEVPYDGDSRRVPFSPQMIDDHAIEWGASSPGAEEEFFLEEYDDDTADGLIAELADGDERVGAFLEAISAGHSISAACRISELPIYQGDNIIRRLRQAA